MKAREYMGCNLYPASSNSAGIRWWCFGPRGGMLRADTLAGLKELIRHEK